MYKEIILRYTFYFAKILSSYTVEYMECSKKRGLSQSACLAVMHKTLGKIGVEVSTGNHSTYKVETGGSQVQGYQV